MRRMLIRMGWTVLAVFVVIQFFRPSRTNPPIDESRTIEAYAPMTPAARAVFERACADCHSHRTRWPWYSNVAPASWMLAEHVTDARRHFDVSDWARYNQERAADKLDEICEEVTKGEMPLLSYRLIHLNAWLSEDDVKALCDWSRSARAAIGGGGETSHP